MLLILDAAVFRVTRDVVAELAHVIADLALADLFALFAVAVARPAALLLSFIGSTIDRREWAAAAWFGPKGFASVVYGLLVLESGAPRADEMFHLIAVAVALSIIAHSSSDVLIARAFKGVDI